MKTKATYYPTLEKVNEAAARLKDVAVATPLQLNLNLSDQYNANIFLKREDLQSVRSFKIRGAYNKIASLTSDELENGVVCASAGNHAQGMAYSCRKLKIKGTVYMPLPTPKQKVEQVKMFGGEYVTVELFGDAFDDAKEEALVYCTAQKSTFIHPFDDEKVIEGQATIALELLEQQTEPMDFLFIPVGGGGLAAGVSTIFKSLSPNTKVIGVEPSGAPSMSLSLEHQKPYTLKKLDKFVDGAAVKQVGSITYQLCEANLDEMATVPEGQACDTILKLYNKDAIVVEPAGSLSIAVLDQYKDELKGKNVVCLVSGSNNDITRMEEIKERALLHSQLKHYFLVNFPQRSGALKEFVTEVLGPTDDITHFEYTKKQNREKGPAVVGIVLKNKSDFDGLQKRMKDQQFFGEYLNDKPSLLGMLV